MMMGQSVIPKKTEKINKLFQKYGKDISLEEFKDNFKKDYPKDWDRINKRYKEQVTIPKKNGKKPGPMPNPEKYLENVFNVFSKS
ncbi:hypothetical protein MRN59_10955 (plasmid) [Macrococcoides caseolyticum]|uniref:hypothetical protein n=2 Tax=Macrococcoides caseolyticum TaxID=69966 RepID=UPI000C3392B6|nr:hypothetical protein CW685_11855 [Macrococcus caseolyticus]